MIFNKLPIPKIKIRRGPLAPLLQKIPQFGDWLPRIAVAHADAAGRVGDNHAIFQPFQFPKPRPSKRRLLPAGKLLQIRPDRRHRSSGQAELVVIDT